MCVKVNIRNFWSNYFDWPQKVNRKDQVVIISSIKTAVLWCVSTSLYMCCLWVWMFIQMSKQHAALSWWWVLLMDVSGLSISWWLTMTAAGPPPSTRGKRMVRTDRSGKQVRAAGVIFDCGRGSAPLHNEQKDLSDEEEQTHNSNSSIKSDLLLPLRVFWEVFRAQLLYKTKTLEGKTGGNDCHWSMTKQTEHLENKNMCRAMLLKNICRDFNPHPSITKNRQLLARLPEFCRMSMEAQTWQEIPLWPSIPAELELVSLNLITQ